MYQKKTTNKQNKLNVPSYMKTKRCLILCLHNKPTLTPKDSMRLQCSTKHYTTNKTTIAFEVFNVGFNPTSLYVHEKGVQCWVCLTNQHWHQKSSMLASILYQIHQHWHFKSQCWVPSHIIIHVGVSWKSAHTRKSTQPASCSTILDC